MYKVWYNFDTILYQCVRHQIELLLLNNIIQYQNKSTIVYLIRKKKILSSYLRTYCCNQSDRTNIGCDYLLKFSLYPLSFYLNNPFKLLKKILLTKIMICLGVPA